MSDKPAAVPMLKPIMLYDHLPGILAGYPAVLFFLLGSISYFVGMGPDGANYRHMMFWIGLSVMLVWYVAFRFNLPKSKFLLMFGLLGTFVGIPVVLELTGRIRPFSWTGELLGRLAPEANSGAWFALSLVFFLIWLGNYIYSRTHLRVRIDESGLTVNRLGGKGERFELIGLKTENEPLDYLELFLAGVGSLKLKTRMNKPIFEMKRVIGLYRTPWFPFFKSKLARIEEMLSYQGKVVSVDVAQEKVDMAEQADMAESDALDDDITGEDGGSHGEFDEGTMADETGQGESFS